MVDPIHILMVLGGLAGQVISLCVLYFLLKRTMKQEMEVHLANQYQKVSQDIALVDAKVVSIQGAISSMNELRTALSELTRTLQNKT